MPPAKDVKFVAVDVPLLKEEPITLTVAPACVIAMPAPNELLAVVMASLFVTVVLLIFIVDPPAPPRTISIPPPRDCEAATSLPLRLLLMVLLLMVMLAPLVAT